MTDGALYPAGAAHDPRDVRRGGRWSRGQRLKNALIFRAIKLGLSLADVLPRGALIALGAALGRAAWTCLGAERRRALANLRRALPDLDARSVARECFVNAGRNLTISLLLRRSDVAASELCAIDAASLSTLERALSEGRGVVFVSAHLGPFELVAARVAELGVRPAVIVRESYDPRLDPLVDAQRTARGVEVVHSGRPGAALRALRILRAGRALGVLPDLASRVASTHATFLGQPTLVPVGPQRLAARSGAALLVGTLRADVGRGDHFHLVIERIDVNQPERRVTQCVTDRLSEAIVSDPGHWLWMARRFEALPGVVPAH